ncbi:MAG: hypothetical protein EXS37_13540 [Opitutus sp.]|nr:hypothetical protein [Opitutus sp.]
MKILSPHEFPLRSLAHENFPHEPPAHRRDHRGCDRGGGEITDGAFTTQPRRRHQRSRSRSHSDRRAHGAGDFFPRQRASGAALPHQPLAAGGGGFPVPQIDLDHPYHGQEEINVDAFLAYSGKVNERLRYRVQLNVPNLLTGKKSFLSTHVNAFGESIFTIIETPRSYALTLDLMF